MDQREAGVAAEDRPPVAREAVLEAARQRIDADDGSDAERDAGEEDPEAREAAAQVAEGEAQDRRQSRGASDAKPAVVLHAGAIASASMRPERRRIIRSQ